MSSMVSGHEHPGAGDVLARLTETYTAPMDLSCAESGV
jgi:hypothetical protein